MKFNLSVFLRIAISILLIGLLSKVLHWPFSIELINIGYGLIFIFYILRFYLKKIKTNLDWIKLLLITTWCVYGVILMNHLPFRLPFQIATIVIFLIWYFKEGFIEYYDKTEYLSEKQKPYKTLLNSIPIIGFILMQLGVLFKIMHWPGASVSLIVGVVICIVSLFIYRQKTSN